MYDMETCICIADLFLLVQWLDSDDVMYDTVAARDVTPPERIDVLDLQPGDRCQALYQSRYYSVQVVAIGIVMYI